MPIVRALASTEGGRALLELRNGWDRAVMVNDALVSLDSGQGLAASILDSPLRLNPGDSAKLDVSDVLQGVLAQAEKSPGISFIKIALVLGPEPPEQPAAATYKVELLNGKFVCFERE